MSTYSRISVFAVQNVPLLIMIRSAECSTSIELNVEFVLIFSCSLDVNAVLVVCVSGGVNESFEGSVEVHRQLHNVVAALGLHV